VANSLHTAVTACCPRWFHVKWATLYNILAGKLRREEITVSPRHRWEVSIKMDLGEAGCDNVELVHCTQDIDQ
jgi:hypothetical protein